MNEAAKILRIIPQTVNSHPSFKDRTGQQFGRLTVLGYQGKDSKRNSYWKCKCECGAEVVLASTVFTTGNTRSCGCLRNELAAARCSNKSLRATWRTITTHGLTESSEYRSWSNMKSRCFNPKNTHYKYYGGSGVIVCERWLHLFENFIKDMGMKPSPDLSIDRWPDKNGNYEPGNCRWGTDEQQANNKTNNSVITFSGMTMTMAEWSRKTGIKYWTLADRLKRWTVEESLTRPTRKVARSPKQVKGALALARQAIQNLNHSLVPSSPQKLAALWSA